MEKNELENLILQRTKKNADFINDKIAFLRRDTNHKFKTKNIYFNFANILNNLATNVETNKLSFEQEEIYQKLLNNESFKFSAKTSFGKTWLIRKAFKKSIENALSINFSKNCFTWIHIVPNEILELDIMNNVKNEFKNLKYEKLVNVDINLYNENINNFNYIVGTPEKIYPLISSFKKVEKIIADEAHEMYCSDDERSLFYKMTFKQLSLKFEWANKIEMGAFLEGKDVLIKKGFSSLYVIENFENEILLKDEKKENNINIEKNSKITLKFFSSAKKCLEDFKNDFLNDKKKYLDRYVELSNKDFTNQKIRDEFANEMTQKYYSGNIENEFLERYDVIDGLKIGVALYHSKMPKELKWIIYQMCKKKIIFEIYSTSSIVGGLDFDISKIIIQKTKINRKSMSIETFFNIAGRAGRYRAGEEPILGLVKIKKDDENINWFNKNKKNIETRRFENNIFENKKENFNIIKTINEYKKERDKNLKQAYLIDPRIHPDITKRLFDNRDKTKEILEDIKKIFNIINKDRKIEYYDKNWIRICEVKKYMKEFLNIYTQKEYKFKGTKELYKLEWKELKIIKYFFNYILKEKNETKIFHNYGFFLKNRKNKVDFSKNMKILSQIIYTEVKYALYSYVNHFLTLCVFLNLETKKLDELKEDISLDL